MSLRPESSTILRDSASILNAKRSLGVQEVRTDFRDILSATSAAYSFLIGALFERLQPHFHFLLHHQAQTFNQFLV